MTIVPKYEKISPFYLNPNQKAKIAQGITLYGYDWTHSNFDWYKELLKKRLRERQFNLCCYCRRSLRFDKGLVEIEHVINKSQKGIYSHFAFEIKNLALSCKDCNNNKGSKSVLLSSSTLATYPKNGSSFAWVHPYFHKYSDHIIIHEAWVYEANSGSPEGFSVIEKCKLDLLEEKERKNRKLLVASADNFDDALQRTVGLVSQVGLDALCQELAPLLASMMKGRKDRKRAAQAIRDAHAAVQRIALAANP